MSFNYTLNYQRLDLREDPYLYKVGKGEQGVLLVEPYKTELLPSWKFRTPKDAEASSKTLLKKFYNYKKEEDFVGMDMARKYLQMGYTRARRYANHKNGKKYKGPVPKDKRGQSGSHGRDLLPISPDSSKAHSAQIFYRAWKEVEDDVLYRALKTEWKVWYG
jgi:hypothetical protein